MKITCRHYYLFDNKETNLISMLDKELKLSMCFSVHAVADFYGYEISFTEQDPVVNMYICKYAVCFIVLYMEELKCKFG